MLTTRPDPDRGSCADWSGASSRHETKPVVGRRSHLRGTWEGIGNTAFATDVFSRLIVGWRTAAPMPTELPLDALEMAIWNRGRRPARPLDGVIHHSDAGAQYTSIRYTSGSPTSARGLDRHRRRQLRQRDGRDLIGLYKTECIRRDGPFRTVDELELATASWVHWFNHQRLHSAISYIPPIEYETAYYRQHPPTAAAARDNRPPRNPGRFKRGCLDGRGSP